MEPRTTLLLFILFAFIAGSSGQACSTAGFDSNIEVPAPLDTITFDNIGLTGPWYSASPPLRVTPGTSMEVTLTGINDNYNYIRVATGSTILSPDWSTTWNRADYYVSFPSYRNGAILDFASPIRQFSIMLSHDTACAAVGWMPIIILTNSTGSTITCMQFNVPPTPGSTNEYHIFRYRSTTANVKSITLSTCSFAFDNIRYKIDPCSPNPCNTEEENCYDDGLDALCCAKNATWNGVKCLTGDPCLDVTTCDPLATCKILKTGGYKCTCPTEYIGSGSPGNCNPITPAPSNSTSYDIVPILECIDENNVAQFGYLSNETRLLLIDDPLRNNLDPFNTAPIEVFAPGRSLPYPLNPGQVPLNITSDQYIWLLEDYRLEFSNKPVLACPIQLSIIFRFVISGAINTTLFAEQTRLSFISSANVTADRVILVNVTSSAVNKRSVSQQDLMDLEVELSVLPPPNNTQQSSAEVIRDFVSDRQDDFEYELNQNNPDTTISTSVTAKESDAALKGVIPRPVAPVAEPISAPLDDNSPIEQQQNSTTPRSSIVSSVQRSHVSCAWLLLALPALAL